MPTCREKSLKEVELARALGVKASSLRPIFSFMVTDSRFRSVAMVPEPLGLNTNG